MKNFMQLRALILKYRGSESYVPIVVIGCLLSAGLYIFRDDFSKLDGLLGQQTASAAGSGAVPLIAMTALVAAYFWLPLRRKNDAGVSFKCNEFVFRSLQNMEKSLRLAYAQADSRSATDAEREAFFTLARDAAADLSQLSAQVNAAPGAGPLVSLSLSDRSSGKGKFISVQDAVSALRAKSARGAI